MLLSLLAAVAAAADPRLYPYRYITTASLVQSGVWRSDGKTLVGRDCDYLLCPFDDWLQVPGRGEMHGRTWCDFVELASVTDYCYIVTLSPFDDFALFLSDDKLFFIHSFIWQSVRRYDLSGDK